MKSHTVFVGGIPGNHKDKQIYDFFSTFGTITDIQLPMKSSNQAVNSGYCFVTFLNSQSKEKVLAQGDLYMGSRRVTCKEYLKGSALNQLVGQANEKKLFVKFVPEWMSEQGFKAFFERFGRLQSYYMVKYREPETSLWPTNLSVGYLVYENPQIYKELIAKKYFKIGKTKMQVEKFKKDFSRLHPDSRGERIQDTGLLGSDLSMHCFKPTERNYRANQFRRNMQRIQKSRIESDPSQSSCIERYRFNVGDRADSRKIREPLNHDGRSGIHLNNNPPLSRGSDFESSNSSNFEVIDISRRVHTPTEILNQSLRQRVVMSVSPPYAVPSSFSQGLNQGKKRKKEHKKRQIQQTLPPASGFSKN